MSTHGLLRAHHAIQSNQARIDWQWLAALATQLGVPSGDLTPPAKWGWKRIDKRISTLKARIQAAHPEQDVTLPSARG